MPEPSQPDVHVPLQRRGPLPPDRPLAPDRPLVGGRVPDDVLDGLAARLADEAGADGGSTVLRPRRPAVLAAVGAAVVLVALVGAMTVIGLFV